MHMIFWRKSPIRMTDFNLKITGFKLSRISLILDVRKKRREQQFLSRGEGGRKQKDKCSEMTEVKFENLFSRINYNINFPRKIRPTQYLCRYYVWLKIQKLIYLKEWSIFEKFLSSPHCRYHLRKIHCGIIAKKILRMTSLRKNPTNVVHLKKKMPLLATTVQHKIHRTSKSIRLFSQRGNYSEIKDNM